MKKYSKVYNYKYGETKNLFRYNYENSSLEYIYKPDPEDVASTREEAKTCRLAWMKEDAKKNLESFEQTGYFVAEESPLNKENWESAKHYYMDLMSENIACEVQAQLNNFV